VNAVAWSPDGRFLAAAGDTTPFVKAWPFDAGYRRADGLGRFGRAFPDPAALPAGISYGVAFAATLFGTAVAVVHDTTPFVTVYPWSSGGGFGTKLTNPATLPGGNGRGVVFSPFDQALLIAHQTTPFVSAYPFTAPARLLYPVSGYGLESGAAPFQSWVSRIVEDGLDLVGLIVDSSSGTLDAWLALDGVEWDRLRLPSGGAVRLDLPLRFEEAVVPLATATRVYRGQVVGAATGTPFFYGPFTGAQGDRAVGVALEDVDNGSGLDGDQVVRIGTAVLGVMAGNARVTFLGG
jgi:hypothetical protein